MSVHKYGTVFSVYTRVNKFLLPMISSFRCRFVQNPYFVIPMAKSHHLLRQCVDQHKNRALLRPATVLMLPTRAASAFHAAVHDLRVARLVRLANKNVTTNVSIETFDYAGMMRAVELTRAELLLSGRDVSFQANRNTAALKPMMRPLPTSSRQPFAQM
jgi:hypothetical protein